MKKNESILDTHLFNKFDDIDRNTFLSAMKEAQVEAIKEVVKRFRSQGNPFFDKKFKSVDDIALELIKEIEL